MAKSKSWIEQTADKVEEHARQHKGESSRIICASGISPSGPIHLGNLREIITVHLVTEELRRRGRDAEHVHSWDDFDRLRKVPFGMPEGFEQFIGMSISAIPDPFGEYESYALRYEEEFEQSISSLGIRPRYVRQSVAYPRGDYRAQIKSAMEKRFLIFDILAKYQTPGRHEKPLEQRRSEYYPFKVYCEVCGKDITEITHYEQSSATISYTCLNDGHTGTFSLDEKVAGKLVWKVDWPMRWNYEAVDFEPGGEDHSAPGSSYTVGKQIVRDIYGGVPPYFVGYAFVGLTGRSKISSSAGTSATPRAALDILEPCIIRWLYIRRNVGQKFDINFGQEVVRLYDEWDSFTSRVNSGKADEADQLTYLRCTQTTQGDIAKSKLPVPFRILSSAADITQGNIEQIIRIVSDHLDNPPPAEQLRELIEPRLTCAINWATSYLPEDERTQIKPTHDAETYDSLSDIHKQGIVTLLEKLNEDWSLKGLTTLIYGVPKLLLGLPIDAPPNEEIKVVQRGFFISLYHLLCGSDTGPRLPTLFLSLGQERVRSLLTPRDEP
ncbi:MAG TPA: lysine--tRNA ligase [Pyrinomonadaceae bacterium]